MNIIVFPVIFYSLVSTPLCFTESIVEERELTDAQLLRLTKKITNEFDLMTLAVLGLGMDESVVSGHIANKDDIKMAAFHTLKEWKTSQTNSRVAYINICKALKHKDVDKALHVDECFSNKC